MSEKTVVWLCFKQLKLIFHTYITSKVKEIHAKGSIGAGKTCPGALRMLSYVRLIFVRQSNPLGIIYLDQSLYNVWSWDWSIRPVDFWFFYGLYKVIYIRAHPLRIDSDACSPGEESLTSLIIFKELFPFATMFYKLSRSNCEDGLHIDPAFREWPRGKHSF